MFYLNEASVSNQSSLAVSQLYAQDPPRCAICLQPKGDTVSEGTCPSQLGEGLLSRAAAGVIFKKLFLAQKCTKPLYKPAVA